MVVNVMTMVANLKRMLAYGFLIWLIPFLVSLAIFPLKETNRGLFESIMPVVVSACVVFFSISYFSKLGSQFLREGTLTGTTWLTISLAIDLFMFLPESPMQMPFIDYMADIGLTYLIMPAITIGFGQLLEKRISKMAPSS